MAKFEKQYKIITNQNLRKLELKVYFEINHKGWVPLGGAIFVKDTYLDGYNSSFWVQTLWLPEEYWPEEKKAEMEPKAESDDNSRAIHELTG